MIGAILAAALVSVPPDERALLFDSVEHNTLRPCRSAPAPGACKLKAALTADGAQTMLAGRATAFRREGDQFLVIARRHTDQAFLCCAARGKLDRIGGDLWAIRLRITDLDRAIVEARVAPQMELDPSVYRGPDAPPRPRFVDTLQGHVSELAIRSPYLGQSRRITVYTPPAFDPARRYPVVYMADGQGREQDARMIEALIDDGAIPPIVMVAIWAAEDGGVRNQEYLSGWPIAYGHFAAAETFLLKEVIRLAEDRFGASPRREDRMITGFSSGAAWAVSMGVRHPGVFGHVAAFSIGWPGAETGVSAPGRPPLFLAAGTLEPVYHRETLRVAQKARRSGDELVVRDLVSGHTGSAWAPMEAEALTWAFGGRRPA